MTLNVDDRVVSNEGTGFVITIAENEFYLVQMDSGSVLLFNDIELREIND